MNNFNREFWENFLNSSENLSKTCVIENAIKPELVEKLNNAVVDGLINRFKTNDHDGFRLYFPSQGKGKENTEFINELYKTPPHSNENIIHYCQRVFKERFGLIINFVEKHSQFISSDLRQIMDPLLKIIGMPATGIDVTVFIGNYGWTPLGIHQDHKGENVLHFHLGPGRKKMYIWDEDKYNKLTGTKHNNFDIDPLLEHAEEFDFGAGDLFYMPWNKFHIGKSDDLSVGVTFWFNHPSKVRFFDKIMNTFYTNYVDNNNEIIEPKKYCGNGHTDFDEFLSIIKLDDDILEGSTIDFFRFLYKDYKFGLSSNAGWHAAPQSLTVEENYNVDDYDYLLDSQIYSPKPFKIHYESYEKNDLFVIYARGSKIEIKYNSNLPELIDKLNTHKIFSVKDLLHSLEEEWPIEAGLYLISMILDKRAAKLADYI